MIREAWEEACFIAGDEQGHPGIPTAKEVQYVVDQILYKAPPPVPDGQFQIIYADPPWEYDNSGFSQSAASHYPTMNTDKICALPIVQIAADDAVLLLWVTAPMLPDGLRVLGAWGFEYVTCIVWVKPSGPGIGWWTDGCAELMLIGKRGKSVHPAFRLQSVMEYAVTEHSKKPAEVYKIIEDAWYHNPKVELFARNEREGWTYWGNEVGGGVE